MAEDKIRLQYSGLLFFASNVISVVTATAYMLIVANTLSTTDYGALGRLNLLLPAFMMLGTMIPFWTLRFVARKKEGAAKTGLLASLIVGVLAAAVYLMLFPLVIPAYALGAYIVPYLLMAVQIAETYVVGGAEACIQAQRPHLLSYGMLILEVTPLPLAYILILRMQLGVLGVFLAVLPSISLKLAFYFKVLQREIRQKVNLSYMREWIKGSAFTFYNAVGNQLTLIPLIALGIYGGSGAVSGAGYYYASAQIATLVGYSSALAIALYPKLLAENKTDDASTALRLVLMFAIPMLAGVLAMPAALLLFLKGNGAYSVAAPILCVLAADAFVVVLIGIFTSVLYGVEQVDAAEINLRKVAKSSLFFAFSLPYIQAAVSVPATFAVLWGLAQRTPLNVALYLSAVTLAGHLVAFSFLCGVLHRRVKLKISWPSICKYLLAAGLMAAVIYLMHPARRLAALPMVGVGAVTYFGVLFLIDSPFRKLLRTAASKIKSRSS